MGMSDNDMTTKKENINNAVTGSDDVATNSIRVTVVIPNFNGYRFLSDCMSALDKQDCDCFETVVVDNGSSDESISWLGDWVSADAARRFLIQMPENGGFSFAVNAGIRRAIELEREYVILLNNDTKVHSDFISKLVERFDRDKNHTIFALSSRMVKMADPSVIDDAGDQYTVLAWQYQRGLDEAMTKFATPARVFSACAGAAIYRTEALNVVGLFDEAHFAYLEDIDVSFRANLYGYQVYFEPSAICEHVGSGTSGSKYNDFKVRLSSRNSIYVLYKNLPVWMLILNSPFLLVGFIVKQLYFCKKGFGKTYFLGLMEGFKTAGTLKKARLDTVPPLRYISIELRLLSATCEYISMKLKKHHKK